MSRSRRAIVRCGTPLARLWAEPAGNEFSAARWTFRPPGKPERPIEGRFSPRDASLDLYWVSREEHEGLYRLHLTAIAEDGERVEHEVAEIDLRVSDHFESFLAVTPGDLLELVRYPGGGRRSWQHKRLPTEEQLSAGLDAVNSWLEGRPGPEMAPDEARRMLLAGRRTPGSFEPYLEWREAWKALQPPELRAALASSASSEAQSLVSLDGAPPDRLAVPTPAALDCNGVFLARDGDRVSEAFEVLAVDAAPLRRARIDTSDAEMEEDETYGTRLIHVRSRYDLEPTFTIVELSGRDGRATLSARKPRNAPWRSEIRWYAAALSEPIAYSPAPWLSAAESLSARLAGISEALSGLARDWASARAAGWTPFGASFLPPGSTECALDARRVLAALGGDPRAKTIVVAAAVELSPEDDVPPRWTAEARDVALPAPVRPVLLGDGLGSADRLAEALRRHSIAAAGPPPDPVAPSSLWSSSAELRRKVTCAALPQHDPADEARAERLVREMSDSAVSFGGGEGGFSLASFSAHPLTSRSVAHVFVAHLPARPAEVPPPARRPVPVHLEIERAYRGGDGRLPAPLPGDFDRVVDHVRGELRLEDGSLREAGSPWGFLLGAARQRVNARRWLREEVGTARGQIVSMTPAQLSARLRLVRYRAPWTDACWALGREDLRPVEPFAHEAVRLFDPDDPTALSAEGLSWLDRLDAEMEGSTLLDAARSIVKGENNQVLIYALFKSFQSLAPYDRTARTLTDAALLTAAELSSPDPLGVELSELAERWTARCRREWEADPRAAEASALHAYRRRATQTLSRRLEQMRRLRARPPRPLTLRSLAEYRAAVAADPLADPQLRALMHSFLDLPPAPGPGEVRSPEDESEIIREERADGALLALAGTLAAPPPPPPPSPSPAVPAVTPSSPPPPPPSATATSPPSAAPPPASQPPGTTLPVVPAGPRGPDGRELFRQVAAGYRVAKEAFVEAAKDPKRPPGAASTAWARVRDAARDALSAAAEDLAAGEEPSAEALAEAKERLAKEAISAVRELFPVPAAHRQRPLRDASQAALGADFRGTLRAIEAVAGEPRGPVPLDASDDGKVYAAAFPKDNPGTDQPRSKALARSEASHLASAKFMPRSPDTAAAAARAAVDDDLARAYWKALTADSEGEPRPMHAAFDELWPLTTVSGYAPEPGVVARAVSEANASPLIVAALRKAAAAWHRIASDREAGGAVKEKEIESSSEIEREARQLLCGFSGEMVRLVSPRPERIAGALNCAYELADHLHRRQKKFDGTQEWRDLYDSVWHFLCSYLFCKPASAIFSSACPRAGAPAIFDRFEGDAVARYLELSTGSEWHVERLDWHSVDETPLSRFLRPDDEAAGLALLASGAGGLLVCRSEGDFDALLRPGGLNFDHLGDRAWFAALQISRDYPDEFVDSSRWSVDAAASASVVRGGDACDALRPREAGGWRVEGRPTDAADERVRLTEWLKARAPSPADRTVLLRKDRAVKMVSQWMERVDSVSFAPDANYPEGDDIGLDAATERDRASAAAAEAAASLAADLPQRRAEIAGPTIAASEEAKTVDEPLLQEIERQRQAALSADAAEAVKPVREALERISKAHLEQWTGFGRMAVAWAGALNKMLEESIERENAELSAARDALSKSRRLKDSARDLAFGLGS